MRNQVGEVRPGQFITTFGPGAVIDAKDDSLMILDLKFWDTAGFKIKDSRLASYLKVNYFLKPRTSNKMDLPVIPFPNYHVCRNRRCNNLFDININLDVEKYLKEGPKCPICDFKAYPSRFVLSCENNHIDDFPWHWWVHEGTHSCKGSLKLVSNGRTSSLAQLKVECSCGHSRSLSQAMVPTSFKDYKCTGRHPFKLAHEKNCDAKTIPLQRGASNVYFPVLRSAISIPPWNNPINELLEEHYTLLLSYRNDFGELGEKKIYENYFKEKYTKEEFDEAVRKREEGIEKYSQIKQMEYEAITHFKDYDGKVHRYFKAEEEDLSDDLKPYFTRLIKVHRLREVLVLLGFMRNSSPEPEVEEPKGIVHLECKKSDRDKWLPAVDINGEGIFLEINKETISKWLDENKKVSILSEKYQGLFDQYIEEKGWTVQSTRDSIYVMMHTLAHLLIKELSLQCGYSSTALKERIYYDEKMAGILIYTGSSDKEGSLGGLVEMGSIDKFRSVLVEALENATFCTNDPLCSTLEPNDTDINGSACHSCSMLSETSCETGNRLLDRSLIISVPDKNIKGFFDGLV